MSGASTPGGTQGDVRPLAGVRVLEIASLYAGPFIGTILADFGADVLKIEHPQGDAARSWGKAKDGVPLWWKIITRNKRLARLDLHDTAARQTVTRLAHGADVVIENFRPGRLAEWGLGYQQLSIENPGLIMVHVTGFGQVGPNAQQPGFGTLAEAFSGFAQITGHPGGPPTLPPFGLADGVAALAGAYATAFALYWRDVSSGRGQEIDLSLYEPLFAILGPQLTEYSQLGALQPRLGNRSARTVPRNAYETADGRWVVLSAGTQQIAERIMTAIGRPDLVGSDLFKDAKSRLRNADVIDRIVAEQIRCFDFDDVIARFEAAQAPIAGVMSVADILADPHYKARGSHITVADPDLGSVTMQNVMPRLSLTPGAIRFAGPLTETADPADVIDEWSQR